MNKLLFSLLLSFTLCAAPAAYAAAPGNAAPPVQNDVPIHVTSDGMVYDTNKNTVVFTGNVEVERENFRMWSAVLTLYLKSSPDKGKTAPAGNEEAPALQTGDLDRIVAEKNVRFRYNTQSGTAAKATYTVDDAVLLLEGDPVIRDGENSVTGERIRYFMNENRSEVDGGPKKRVQAVFSSGSSSSESRQGRQ